MPDQNDVRRIALALPETVESATRFGFSVRAGSKPKDFVWVWLERIEPKKARVPNPDVLAVRVGSLHEKNLMIEMAPDKYFTESHYNGYPAVLVRLAAVTEAELQAMITEAWRCQAPRALVRKFDEEP